MVSTTTRCGRKIEFEIRRYLYMLMIKHEMFILMFLISTASNHVVASEPTFNHRGISYIPSLSQTLLDRSRMVIGDESRMHRFINKLVNGQHVKYAILGSSIATCRGASHIDTGWTAAFHKWLELSFTPCGSELPGSRFFSSYPDYWISRHLCNRRYRLCNASMVCHVLMWIVHPETD